MGPGTTILDVGHGNCAVVTGADGNNVVVDAGPGSALLEHLASTGITEIQCILISHADKDHIAGVLALLEAKTAVVRAVHLNSDSMKGSALWGDLVYELDGLRLHGDIDFTPSLSANDEDITCGDVKIEVLGPSPALAAKGPGSVDRDGRKIDTNSISAVLRLVYNDAPRILFTGDLDRVGLSDLLRCKVELKAAVLVFPHHGGRPGTSDPADFASELTKLVEPDLVVFSIGRALKPKNPLPEVVESVRSAVDGVRIACTQLSHHCAASVPDEEPKHLLPLFARGRSRRQCCAGSLFVKHEPEPPSPPADQHVAFIDKYAPEALCRK